MKEDFLKKVGIELLIIRTEHGDRLEDLYKKSKVHPSTISKYENGNEDMSLEKLQQILEPYNISLPIFFKRILAKTQDKED